MSLFAPNRAVMLAGLLASLSLMMPAALPAANLIDIYTQAADYDAELQAAIFEHQAAQQQVPLARSSFLPQLNAGASASINDVNDDRDGSFRSNQFSLSLSQSLFNQPNRALLDQAELVALQADAQLMSARQQLILRVANAYFGVLSAEANLTFSRSELEAISRQREQAERRFDVGLVPITDVRDAQAQYDLAVADEIAAENQAATAREALRVISGQSPETLAELADDLPLVGPDPANVNRWVEFATEQNLELTVAQLNEQAARARIAEQRGARYPTLDLVAIGSSADTEQLGRPDVDAGELRLELNLPLYSGGRISAQVSRTRAEAMAESERLVASERSVTQSTRDAYRGVLASISRVRALEQALISTQKSAEATEAGFSAGTRTSVDVLRALRDTFSAKSNFAAARYDYILNTLQLKAAAGTLSPDDLDAINKFLNVEDEAPEAGAGEAPAE